MSRPDAYDLACDAALLATADKRVPEFVRVVFGEQPLHSRGYGIQVSDARPVKVYVGQNLFRLCCERYLPQHHVLPQPFLARFALQPLAVYHLYAGKFRLAQSEQKQYKQRVRPFDLLVRFTVIYQPRLFVERKRVTPL